jgi:hypothetical protein
MTGMATNSTGQDTPPFTTPPAESSRFQGNAAMHSDPEKEMSGNLPVQPRGLEVDAAPDNGTPWKGLTNGR